MGYNRETIEQLKKFRQNMGSDLFQEDAKKIFKASVGYLEKGEVSEICTKKLNYARSFVKNLKVFNLVRFIAVSGSVAAKIAKDGDDIDIFVVIKNNTLWIYRGFMLLKNIFNKRSRRVNTDDLKDKMCVNLICEERGLKFQDDIFNLHELYYLIPIYNESYYEEVLASNQWLKKWGGVIRNFDKRKRKFNIFIEAINLYFFIPQIIFMIIFGHKPEVRRILNNYIKGRVEFYDKEFKEEKISLLYNQN